MGMMYVSARKKVEYEEFKELKQKIIEYFKELGFKTEGSENEEQEVFIRFEEWVTRREIICLFWELS